MAQPSSEFTEAVEQQGKLWSAAGQNWAELMAPTTTPVWGACLDLARVTKGTRLLDVGCGTGETLALARFRGAEVAGIDPAAGFLEIAQGRLPDADLRRASMEDIPFEDDAFDAVVLSNSLMYSDDRDRAFDEIGRVLAADGHLAVGIWAEKEASEFRHVINALVEVLPEPPTGEGPFSLSPPSVLEALLESTGFEPTTTREVSVPFTYVDQEHFLRAVLGTGPGQAVRQQVGEVVVTEALLDVGEAFVQGDGAYRLENRFRVVGATPKAE